MPHFTPDPQFNPGRPGREMEEGTGLEALSTTRKIISGCDRQHPDRWTLDCGGNEGVCKDLYVKSIKMLQLMDEWAMKVILNTVRRQFKQEIRWWGRYVACESVRRRKYNIKSVLNFITRNYKPNEAVKICLNISVSRNKL